MSSTMNLSRALTRETRYLRSSDQTDVIAARISFACSFGTKTPMSRDARHRRKPAADEDAEAVAAVVVNDADERDAVDLGRVAAVGAGRDRVLVLARQVRPVGIAVEEVGRRLDDGRGVEELVARDALHRAAGEIGRAHV